MGILTGKTYDRLKFAALILLPAVGTLYFGLAQVWGMPNAEKVVGTITAVDTFLGVVLGISTKNYYNSGVDTDGDLNVHHDEDGETHLTLGVNGSDVNDMTSKNLVTLRVVHAPKPQ